MDGAETSAEQMSERRRHHRIAVKGLMEARLFVEGRESKAQVVDLNNAGAFVATDLSLEKNTPLQIELFLAGEHKSLPLKALVARCSEKVEGRRTTIPAGVGVVFRAENVMERAFIQKAVLEALKDSLETTKTHLEAERRRCDEAAHHP